MDPSLPVPGTSRALRSRAQMVTDQAFSRRSSRSASRSGSSSGHSSRTHSLTRAPSLSREPMTVWDLPDVIDRGEGPSSSAVSVVGSSRQSDIGDEGYQWNTRGLANISPTSSSNFMGTTSGVASSSIQVEGPVSVGPQPALSPAVKAEPVNAPIPSSSTAVPDPDPNLEPLSAYTCPICFYPPRNATLTPCGHVCCGQCLFEAVKSGMARGGIGFGFGRGRGRNDEGGPRCPVCRAFIPGWDGKGGGVIGLRAAVMTVVE